MTLPEPYYSDESCTVYCADALEVLPLLEADVMVTDPPYGLDAPLNSGGKRGKVTPRDRREVPEWDQGLAVRDEVLRQWGDRPAVVFASVTKPPPRRSPATSPCVGQGRGGRHG